MFPRRQPAPAAPGVRNLRFGYTIDGAPRPDAHASVQAHLVTNGNDGRSVASVLPLGTGSHEVTVFLDRPLSTLTRLMIKYDSGHFPHHSITLKGITVVAELDDRSTQQLAVELTNLSIEHEGTSTLDFTGFTWARPTTATNRDVARVKTHLGANPVVLQARHRSATLRHLPVYRLDVLAECSERQADRPAPGRHRRRAPRIPVQ